MLTVAKVVIGAEVINLKLHSFGQTRRMIQHGSMSQYTVPSMCLVLWSMCTLHICVHKMLYFHHKNEIEREVQSLNRYMGTYIFEASSHQVKIEFASLNNQAIIKLFQFPNSIVFPIFSMAESLAAIMVEI